MAAEVSEFGTVVAVKEEIDLVDIADEVDEEEENVGDEGAYMGEGLFTFGDFDESVGDDNQVPDRDPLGADCDMIFPGGVNYEENEENVANICQNELSVKELQNDIYILLEEESTLDMQESLVITAVKSLQVESVAGSTNLRAACFRNLDIFRCFLCLQDFDTFDDFIVHRTKSRKHMNVQYDAEREKPFCCGICQKPWNQPRKALACAVHGHDPSKIQEAMFVHACPLCPENHFAYHSLAAVGRHWVVAHCDKPLPRFLAFCTGNDQLPSIKLSHLENRLVTESMVKDNPNLVLENWVSIARNSIGNSECKALKVYRCSDCMMNFETRREVELHNCSAKSIPASCIGAPSKQYICEDCGREFQCARNFRDHLLRAGVCRTDSNALKDNPYKCIFCGSLFITYKSYSSHRSKAHAAVPYRPELELPFACKICEKPAFVKKQAMICALFGHDPSGLRKAMFRYKCSQCVSFGFHSPFALKRHWELEHPDFPIPDHLKDVTMDRPLPTVSVTLEQLLSLNRFRDLGSTLVVDREIPPLLAKISMLQQSINIPDQTLSNNNKSKADITLKTLPPKYSVEAVQSSPDQLANTDLIRRSLIEESIERKMCVICEKSFKDIRRHFKIHDQSRFSGSPIHACVCGKKYHLRNSLHSHWKKNRDCKLQYLKQNKKAEKDTGAKVSKPDISSQEYVLKIPSPSHSPFEDLNIKIELPEIRAVVATDHEVSDNVTVPNVEAETIDLYSEYAKFDLETSELDFSPKETETIDLRNFIHLEVEEVPDECDDNGKTFDVTTKAGMDNDIKDGDKVVIEPNMSRVCICSVCQMEFPSQTLFLNHIAKEHKGAYPYESQHCGKRFKLDIQRHEHEVIHEPMRFHGKPRFSCDKCDNKYHLKTSLETHRKVKHLGYVKPKSRRRLSILKHHAIGAGRQTTGDNTKECKECGLKFNHRHLLDQHIARIHKGERSYKCEICKKRFFHAASRNKHVRRAHEMANKKVHLLDESLKTKQCQKNSNPSERNRFQCNKCFRNFAKPVQLEQHNLLHTGEKPHVCDHCGRGFRLRKSWKVHQLIHQSVAKNDVNNMFKCVVCGRHDFIRANDLHRHRQRSHKNIPYDRKREKAFGCGVCKKPFLLRSQAMVCAILGHDPTQLREAMFKHKCPKCPEERLGYHSIGSFKNHWSKEHKGVTIPRKYLSYPQNTIDSLPCIIINKERAAEIKKNGPQQRKYDFPLVIEFEPYNTKCTINPPPEIEIYGDDSRDDFPTEEELFLSTEISFNDAVNAVKALVVERSSRHSKPLTRDPKKTSPSKKCKSSKKAVEDPQDSLAADRALGNKRIAKVLERLRTARARKLSNRDSATEIMTTTKTTENSKRMKGTKV